MTTQHLFQLILALLHLLAVQTIAHGTVDLTKLPADARTLLTQLHAEVEQKDDESEDG